MAIYLREIAWLIYFILLSLVVILMSSILGEALSMLNNGLVMTFLILIAIPPLFILFAKIYSKYKPLNFDVIMIIFIYIIAFVFQFSFSLNVVLGVWLTFAYLYSIGTLEYGKRLSPFILAFMPEEDKTFSQRLNIRLKMSKPRTGVSKTFDYMHLPEVRFYMSNLYAIPIISFVMVCLMQEGIPHNYKLFIKCGGGFLLFTVGNIFLFRYFKKSRTLKQPYYMIPPMPIIFIMYGLYYFCLGITGIQYPRYPVSFH